MTTPFVLALAGSSSHVAAPTPAAAWRCASAWTGASSFSLTATASPRSPRPPPNSSSAPAAAPVPTAAAPPRLSAPRGRGGPLSPYLPKAAPFTAHPSAGGRAQAESYTPVASFHPLLHPAPGDDIFTEQLT